MRPLAVATAAAIAATGATPEAAARKPEPGPEGSASSWVGARAPAPDDRWVTLVTGDRVLVRPTPTGDQLIRIDPAEGRENIPFRSVGERGELTVLPADAASLVSSGVIDRRLFDVSGLIDIGYDDRSRRDIPLIVSRPARSRSATHSVMGAAGVRVSRELPVAQADAVRADKAAAGKLWRALRSRPAASKFSGGISRLTLDGPVKPTLDASVPQIGAPAAWQAGHTGEGATVAVLDTGIDTTHPDLTGLVVKSANFSDSQNGTADKDGHGTHVASTIAGSGAASGGRYVGVAPGARLLNGKVFADDGSGYESSIIAGMEWAAAEGADVVNMSLSSARPSDGTSLMDQTLNRLSAQSGALFVVSAGNMGPRQGSIGRPAAADAALTVGAVSKQDELAEFSSRGPRQGDHTIKPEITAPGVDIVAARAEGSTLGRAVGDRYQSLNGTSMAAPHVAGAAAILAGQRPDLRGDDLKAILVGTAQPREGLTVFEQGAGRVDVSRATRQGFFSEQATLNLGFTTWPHDDDTPTVQTITYRNVTDSPQTLRLSTDVRDQAGAPAPAGMFTVDPPSITVPARGTASVRLTADTAVPGPDGRFSGVVVATGADGHTARTPVSLLKEVESHDITLTWLDHDGERTPEYSFRLFDVAGLNAYNAHDGSGSVTMRVPKGRYYLDGAVWTLAPDGSVRLWTEVAEPELTVAGPMSLTIDARHGKPFDATVERRSARAYLERVGFIRETAVGLIEIITQGPDLTPMRVRPSTTTPTVGAFSFHVEDNLAEPDGSGGFANTPYTYQVHWQEDGRVPAEPIRHLPDKDLAVLDTRIADTGSGRLVTKGDARLLFATPARLTEYYSRDVRWGSWVAQVGEPVVGDPKDPTADRPWEYSLSFARPERISNDKPVTRRWNVGVFGPAVPPVPSYWYPWVHRLGDRFSAEIPLFTDQPANHRGFSDMDSASMALFRDGVKIADLDPGARIVVPRDPGTYRLEAAATRSVSPLSTRVSAAWTFRSEHVADGWKALPVMAVRFAPELDEHNRPPSGDMFAVPVYVQRQEGAEYGTLNDLTVQASYDDGATWVPVKVTGEGLNRLAHVAHPSGDGFVSLRASATDSAGNSVDQTIIRAYRY